MNILGFNISVSRTTPAAQKALAISPEAWLRGEDLDGGPLLSSAYEQVVWVYRAINALAEQVANLPFVFSAGERGGEDLITSGPLLDFYDRPHPQINRFQYWELRVIWLLLSGECFRIPIFESSSSFSSSSSSSNGRRLARVLIADPSRFQHIIEGHQLIGWRYTGLGPEAPLDSQVFLPEEVWFEKLPNPFDFWRGLSPLSIAAMAAKTDFAAGSFMRGIIENNGDTGLIVRTEQWLSDEQRQQILSALRDRKRRAGQADRPVLLLGSSEILKPELSSSDLQFLENRKFSRAEICAAFGVPEEIVTTTDHAKYDVMTGARLNFIENRVAPLCRRLEAEEEITVKAIDPRASGWFDLDSLPILQEARRNRLAAARTGFEMGIPFNELNRVLDLGFKSLPWGNRAYIGSKLQEVTEEGQNAKAEDRKKAEIRNPDETSTAASGDTRPLAAANADCLTSAPSPAPGHGPLTTDALITALLITPADPMARASHLLSSLSAPQLPTIHYPLLRKLSRFFFEQRGRALAGLAGADSSTEAGAVLDAAAETALLSGITRTAGVPVGGAAGLCRFNSERLAQLHQGIATSRASAETPDQLAALVRRHYNSLAETLPDNLAAALFCQTGQPSPTRQTGQTNR